MSRVCMRSRCDRPAQVRLTYDTLRCRVFLDELPDVAGLYQEICEFHAVRLKLPMGWELSDRRGNTPALFDLEALVRSAPRRSDPIVTRNDVVGSEMIDLSEGARRSDPVRAPEPRPTVDTGRAAHTGRAVPTAAAAHERYVTSGVEHPPRRATGGLRSASARSSRGRGRLPTPSELFGVGRLPDVDTTPEPIDAAMAVVSLGDPSIETVIVLGPESGPERTDSTGGRDGRSL